jgi:hypothetical protein
MTNFCTVRHKICASRKPDFYQNLFNVSELRVSREAVHRIAARQQELEASALQLHGKGHQDLQLAEQQQQLFRVFNELFSFRTGKRAEAAARQKKKSFLILVRKDQRFIRDFRK